MWKSGEVAVALGGGLALMPHNPKCLMPKAHEPVFEPRYGPVPPQIHSTSYSLNCLSTVITGNPSICAWDMRRRSKGSLWWRGKDATCSACVWVMGSGLIASRFSLGGINFSGICVEI